MAAESEQKTSYTYNFNGYEKIQLLKVTWLPILSSFSLLWVKARKASTVERGRDTSGLSIIHINSTNIYRPLPYVLGVTLGAGVAKMKMCSCSEE